jgi:hypothetical protein
MQECFARKNFHRKTQALIEQANAIIAEYRAARFTLTLRQLYYQFVARGFLENSQKSYGQLGRTVNDARLAGLIDWDAIEDRTRHRRALSTWSGPADIIGAAAESYREDLWTEQPYRPEVWIEKDALLGVIEGVCNEWRAPYFACRGFNSQSEQYRAGKRFKKLLAAGLTPVVLHLGDHDPSGIAMTADNIERLAMFAGSQVEVRRLALNMDQVQQHRLPPNPAKDTDTRYEAYVEEFGHRDCWELDALDPRVIADLIRNEVEVIIDRRLWKAGLAREERNRRKLIKIKKSLAQ